MKAVMAHCWRKIGVYGGDHSCVLIGQVHHCRNCRVFQEAARGAFAVESGEDDEALEFAPAGDASLSLLVFRLGDSWLGLPTASLAELAANGAVRRVAHRSRGALEGLVAVRGELHLCVSLLECFALGARDAQRSQPSARLVLVRDRQDALLAFRADQVLGLRSASRDAVEAPPDTLPEQLAACVRGVLPIDRLRVLLLDGDAVHACLASGLYA